MKKVGIVTINDNNNYGNRLQNYALQEYLKKLNCDVTTLKNERFSNNKGSISYRLYLYLRHVKSVLINFYKIDVKRKRNFKEFNKYIKFSKKKITPYDKKINNEYDYFIVGSDQVWKPKFLRMSDVDFLNFSSSEKKISYAASFGISSLKENELEKLKNGIKDFKKISVREDSGKKIIKMVSDRKDIEVLIDPTMLITADEWDNVSKKPENFIEQKYILNYFLGKVSEQRKMEIERIAKKNGYSVINILDSDSPFYNCGPSEFLFLEKNAQLICTDSFHSSVFAIIYNKPFIIFDREGKGMEDMNSRTDTLISKFNLKDRKYNNKIITEGNLRHNYTEAYEILNKEREKSLQFLKDALEIKESDINVRN